MVDLSDRMVELSTEEIKKKANPQGIQPDIRVAAVESLPFADRSFDRLWANYVLHLVNDPDVTLRECFRVLKKGGIAVFSVWGRPENSPKFRLAENAKSKIGFPTPLSPLFHLCDKDKLRERLLKAGFSKVFSWYQFELMDCYDGESFFEYMLSFPNEMKFYKSLNPDQARNHKEALISEANRYFDAGTIIGTEVTIAAGFL